MKSNEDFRVSVYARAEREKRRIAVRRQKVRNASLSAFMVLLVAVVAVPLARDARTDPEAITIPDAVISQDQPHVVKPAAQAARMVLLMDTQAVVLENEAQQKDFMNQYKAAIHLEEGAGAPFPASDMAQAIHSLDELIAFLDAMPHGAEAMKLDYDEAFFEDNNLYAMPMELSAPPEESTTAQRTEPHQTTTASGQTPTIPDSIIPSNADITLPFVELVTTAETTTGMELTSLAGNGLLQGSQVKVLLLVPVNKDA